jgi:hypothetical protein
MFRQFLSYQLILALVFGPLFCCCTTGRLLAAASVHKTTFPSTKATVPAVRAVSSCCAHKQEAARQKSNPSSPDQNPKPSKPTEKCPCKDSSNDPTTTKTGSSSNDTTTPRTTSFEPVIPSFGFANLTPSLQARYRDSSVRGVNASLPSSSDLLFAHHNLRC